MRRAGRPGLIGLAARTAVVAGTANAVTNRSQLRQAERMQAMQAQTPGYAQPPVAPAPPAPVAPEPAASGQSDLITELTKLGELRTAGLLTEEEFAAAKARLLG